MPSPGPGRRPPARGTGPAGRGALRRTTTAAGRGSSTPARTATSAATPVATRSRPRLTSRAAVLVVILAVLAVSYASSLRAYLQQREHLAELQQRIDASNANIERMAGSVDRQDDRSFIEQQGREQGMVFPGEKPFVVLDGGKPLDVEASLSPPSSVDPAEPEAWWTDAWASMEVAGDPPRRTDPRPETKLTDTGSD